MKDRYLLEIGVEELPARLVDDALKQLKENTEKMLENERIEYNNIETYATPRRLVLIINGLSEKQLTLEERVKGQQRELLMMMKENQQRLYKGLCEVKALD